jgi:glycosyltransferase involved in cell wall biosynthesis
MNVLYVSTSVVPSAKANSIQVMNMCSALSKISNRLVLLCYKGDNVVQDYFDFYGIEDTFHIDFSGTNYRGLIRKFFLFRYLKRVASSTDLLYTRDIFAAFLSALFFDMKVVYESHSPENNTLFKRFYFWFLLRAKNVKTVVFISYSLQKIHTRIFGYSKKYTVLHDCSNHRLESDKFIYDGDFLDANNPVIGYAGSLYKGRGIGIILKLAIDFPDCKFLVLGNNIDFIQSNCLEVPSNVIFLGEFYPKEVYVFLRKVDILLAPYERSVSISGNQNSDSSKWMSPLKLFEFLGSKRPILTSDHDVFVEFLCDNEDVIFYKKDEYCSLKEKLDTLLENKDLRVYLTENAYRMHKLFYNWSTRARLVFLEVEKNEN